MGRGRGRGGGGGREGEREGERERRRGREARLAVLPQYAAGEGAADDAADEVVNVLARLVHTEAAEGGRGCGWTVGCVCGAAHACATVVKVLGRCHGRWTRKLVKARATGAAGRR